MNSIRVLLASSIDYAGLFPPAGLRMADAVSTYASSRSGAQAWALGRFVIPVSRLDELEDAARDLLPSSPEAVPWRLSALAQLNGEADIERIIAFNGRHAHDAGPGAAIIDTIELKVQSAQEIRRAINKSSEQIETYFEVPLSDDTPALLSTIAETGGRAKVRTGGLTPDRFPLPSELARFIYLCAQGHVPFKATAGLHHPFRSIHRLNYNPSSPSTVMHGFINVFVAAAFAYAGMDIDTIGRVLEDETVNSFGFDNEGVSWNTHRLTNDQLRDARQQAAVSFGSCSFREPIDDLRSFHLL